MLQQTAVPSSFPGFDRSGSRTPQQQTEDHAQLFAKLIARCAKDIDVLVDSLPSEDSTAELQVVVPSRAGAAPPVPTGLNGSLFLQTSSLRRLEAENQEAALRLEEVVRQGEWLLDKIQATLHDIAQSQLAMQNISSSSSS